MKNSVLESNRWLKEAENDLNLANDIVDKYHSLSCFHSEQCVQKALKAYLYFLGHRAIRIHSCLSLLKEIEKRERSVSRFEENVKLMDQYYIPSRYPDFYPLPQTPSELYTQTQAKEVLGIAKEIFNFIKHKI